MLYLQELINVFSAKTYLSHIPSGFHSGDFCVKQLLTNTHEIYNAFDGKFPLETRGVDISKV